MPRRERSAHQEIFKRTAIKRLPHHFALSLTNKRYLSGIRARLNVTGKRYIEDDTRAVKFDKDIVDEYNKVMLDTKFWHGTGQFQYGSDEKVINVLETILSDHGLKPFPDAYAVYSGGKTMETISLTKSRIIARSYADIHGGAIHEKNRYGSAFFWVSYYYSLFYGKLRLLNARVLRKNRPKFHQLTRNEAGENTWSKKVNRSAQDIWDTFIIGSDIPHNFPILIGIKAVDSPVRLSKIFAQYEVRSGALINIDDFTHLEVPAEKLKDIQSLLSSQKIQLPVFPIELGEQVAATKTISELLNI